MKQKKDGSLFQVMPGTIGSPGRVSLEPFSFLPDAWPVKGVVAVVGFLFSRTFFSLAALALPTRGNLYYISRGMQQHEALFMVTAARLALQSVNGLIFPD